MTGLYEYLLGYYDCDIGHWQKATIVARSQLAATQLLTRIVPIDRRYYLPNIDSLTVKKEVKLNEQPYLVSVDKDESMEPIAAPKLYAVQNTPNTGNTKPRLHLVG